MNNPSSRSILLSGIKHCGKSTIGALLARRIGLPFLDLDDLVEEESLANRGGDRAVRWGVREIYRRLGKDEFVRLEQKALRILMEEGGRFVLALGGGTQENPENRKLLSELGCLVYLSEEAEILYKRVSSGGIPPFLDAEDPRGSFEELYRTRDRLYRRTADIVLPLEGRNPADAAEYIEQTLKEHISGR